MSAISRGAVTAFFLRAGLLTAALAIMAGIFGMHIMTGAHSMPAAGASTPMAQMQSTPAGHESHRRAQSPDATAVAGAMSGSSSCAATGACHEMSAMDAACVLSPGNTSLSAPLPGTAPFAVPDLVGAAAVTTSYSHSPDSPSPGDLCISRT